MMIAFITIKSSLVPLIEGLCAQIYFRFEISVVCFSTQEFTRFLSTVSSQRRATCSDVSCQTK